MNYRKPTLFTFGGCDLWSVMKSKFILRDYNLNSHQPSLTRTFSLSDLTPPIHGTSIVSLFTDPGPLAYRAIEEFPKIVSPSTYHYDVYDELIKFPFIKHWKETATKEDFLILNFSCEFYNRFDNGKEYLSLIPAFNNMPSVDWIDKEILQNSKFIKEFDASMIHDMTREYLRELAKSIHDIFQDRVILVSTHFTDKGIIDSNLSVVKATDNMLHKNYFTSTKLGMNFESMQYAKNCISLINRYFLHRYKSDIPFIKIPDELVFMDLQHDYGVTPFHLHDVSNVLITDRIIEEVKKIQTKYLFKGTST